MLRGNREFLSQYIGWLWVIGPYKKRTNGNCFVKASPPPPPIINYFAYF